MNHYQQIIIEHLPPRYRDATTAALVEDVMRTNHPALNSLTRGEFAAECADVAALFDEHGWIPSYCAAANLTTPSWATAG